jgi:hypothetical protein
VDARKSWQLEELLEELHRGYQDAAVAIDRSGGALDGVGLGEWIHGGDIREALGLPGAYVSEGSDLAVPLLVERSASRSMRSVVATIDGEVHSLGRDDGTPAATLVTDVETFVRLCGGRSPNGAGFTLEGAAPDDLVLFS